MDAIAINTFFFQWLFERECPIQLIMCYDKFRRNKQTKKWILGSFHEFGSRHPSFNFDSIRLAAMLNIIIIKVLWTRTVFENLILMTKKNSDSMTLFYVFFLSPFITLYLFSFPVSFLIIFTLTLYFFFFRSHFHFDEIVFGSRKIKKKIKMKKKKEQMNMFN